MPILFEGAARELFDAADNTDTTAANYNQLKTGLQTSVGKASELPVDAVVKAEYTKSVDKNQIIYLWSEGAIKCANRGDKSFELQDSLPTKSGANQMYWRGNWGAIVLRDEFVAGFLLKGTQQVTA